MSTDRDVIAWARESAKALESFGRKPTAEKYRATAEKYRRLADLAEKGAEDWQPIASAPLDTRILLCAENDVFVGQRWPRITEWGQPVPIHGSTVVVNERGQERIATHWRPLPAPPGGER